VLQQFRIGGCQELLHSFQPITSPRQVDDVGAAAAVDVFGSVPKARAAAPRSWWMVGKAPRSWGRFQDVWNSGKGWNIGKNMGTKQDISRNQREAAPKR